MPPTILTVEAYGLAWLARVRPTLRPASRRLYRHALEAHVFPALGHRPLATITRRDVRALIERLQVPYAPKYVRAIIAAFSAMLTAAVEDDLIPAHPALRLRLPQHTVRRAPAFTAEQLPLVLDACEARAPRLAPLFYLCAHAGLRVGEARAVRKGDADFSARTLHVARTAAQRSGHIGLPKDGPRTIRLPPALAARLAAYEQTVADWYFPGREGWPISYNRVRAVLQDACVAVGVAPRGSHSFRRTAISLLLAAGAPAEFCRRQAGHSSLAVTMAYNDELGMDDPDAFLALGTGIIGPRPVAK